MERFRRLPADAARQAAQRAAQQLARNANVRLIYMFGSAADPQCDTVRDIDLAVLTDPALSFDELMKLRADVVQVTGAPIDLVSLNHASVVLAHEVSEQGRCLYAASADVETEFIVRARARFWDFKPFLDEQWRLTAERLKERRGGSQT